MSTTNDSKAMAAAKRNLAKVENRRLVGHGMKPVFQASWVTVSRKQTAAGVAFFEAVSGMNASEPSSTALAAVRALTADLREDARGKGVFS